MPPPWKDYIAEGGVTPGNTWDTTIIGGMALPGISGPPTAKPSRRIQQKKQSGSDGATPTFRGYEPAKIDITVRIWTPDQLQSLREILRVIWPPANKSDIGAARVQSFGAGQAATFAGGIGSPFIAAGVGAVDAAGVQQSNLNAYDIVHPNLEPLGIRAVVIESVSALVPGSVYGEMVCTIECIEFALPTKRSATFTPKGAKKGAPAVTPAFSAPPSMTGFGPNPNVNR